MNEERRKFITSITFPACFIALLWLTKLFEYISGYDLGHWGIYPHELKGLRGILTAPLIHRDFTHLISNSIPLLISTTGILYFYRKVAVKVFLLLYFMVGFWTWCFARSSYHIGASGLVYGFVFFLFFSGVFRKDTRALAVSLLVTFLYGSMVWGILPVVTDISWESHLMGAIGGIFLAAYFRKSEDTPPPYVWEDDDDNGIDYMGDTEGENESSNNSINPLGYTINYHYKPSEANDNNKVL